MNGWTRFFLVLLRLTIGWHFFFEGITKIQSVDLVGRTETNRPWSSVEYLRSASGPAGDFFRKQAGDLDEEMLELVTPRPLGDGEDPARVPPRQRLPQALDKAWNEYFARFAAHYQLTPEQLPLAQAKLDQAKDQAVRWMLGLGDPSEVERSFGAQATVKVKQTGQERVAEYRGKVVQLREALDQKLPAFGQDVEKTRLNALKGELNRLRTGLLADLERPMHETLETVLTDGQKRLGAVAIPARTRMADWSRLDWIDALTRYGLTAVGVCLLLGLFTRTACLGGAAFLLLFYLAMPALPWSPENPRAEGHYLFVNKNIIEMIALFALATTRSGWWVGLDGLLSLMTPWGRRARARQHQQ